MHLPNIRIKSSFLLNNQVIPLLLPRLTASGNEGAADPEFINRKVREYNEAWALDGTTILQAMCEQLDLEFNQNIIDAYVVPFGHSFSDPMVISTKYTADRFIDVFTHEIAHRLLTDNTKYDTNLDDRLLPAWKEMFGDEHTFVTLVHIPVHAMLQYIFIDILNEPERLTRDQEACKQFEHYDLAWQYVNTHDYKRILTSLKELYATF